MFHITFLHAALTRCDVISKFLTAERCVEIFRNAALVSGQAAAADPFSSCLHPPPHS